jgi:hypothetical protein
MQYPSSPVSNFQGVLPGSSMADQDVQMGSVKSHKNP